MHSSSPVQINSRIKLLLVISGHLEQQRQQFDGDGRVGECAHVPGRLVQRQLVETAEHAETSRPPVRLTLYI